MSARILALTVLLAVPAGAGKPWHTASNHTSLWSPLDEDSTSAVVARELALSPRLLRAVMASGRKNADWDTQPGAVVDSSREALDQAEEELAFARLYTLRVLPRDKGKPGFVAQIRRDGSWEGAGMGERDPVYARANGDDAVVFDGTSVHVVRVWDRADEASDHTELRLDRILPPGSYWVGLVDEALRHPASTLQLGAGESGDRTSVPKIYVLPVDEAGELVVGPPGLVVSVDGDDEQHESVLRAAWIRSDLPMSSWPDEVDPDDNPSARTSVLTRIPPLDPLDLRHVYIDGVVEAGMTYAPESGAIGVLVGGELGLGGPFWSAQLLSRPQLVGGAAWVHSRRRRPFDAGVGLIAGSWAGKARAGVGARIGFLADATSKYEIEGLISSDRAGVGARLMVVDWNLERKQYISGGFVARYGVTTGAAAPQESSVWLGLVFSYSYRRTRISTR